MPDMLVLKRDRRSGALKMLVEIDPAAGAQAWQPPPMPVPNAHRDDWEGMPHGDDVDWAVSCIETFVAEMDPYPLEVTRVHWDSLREDLCDYVRSVR